MKRKSKRQIKIGDTVRWRGAWGFEPERKAKIEGIDLCEREHEKYGEPVSSVSVDDIDRCVLTLDNGHWCYGYQIIV